MWISLTTPFYSFILEKGCQVPAITLHYITLHYITLHYITLHYITLHLADTFIQSDLQ